MNFDLSEEQKMLADQVGALLADQSPPDRLRALIDAGEEWDAPLWQSLCALGLPGICVAEEFGGLGLSDLDQGVVMEALGAANAAVPYASSVVAAARAIGLSVDDTLKAELLPGLASGERLACFAHAEGAADWRPKTSSVDYRDGRLYGTKSPVADGGVAELAVVLCSVGTEPGLAIVALDEPGVTRTRREAFDQLRGFYTIEFDAAPARLLSFADADAAISQLFDALAVQAAFEAVGGASRCITMARDYALERRIFGRPLASYQAIKHKLADCLMRAEYARSNAYYAAWALEHAPQEWASASACARLSALSAFELAARENLQIHGGIGYTFEADCHFYYRRERALSLQLGSRSFWADRLVNAVQSANRKGA